MPWEPVHVWFGAIEAEGADFWQARGRWIGGGI